MKDNRILLIVGAGASTEFGLPTGKLLLSDLSKVAKRASDHYYGDPNLDDRNVKIPEELRESLAREAQQKFSQNWGEEFQRLCEIALWISRNAQLAPSIDNLLHSHRADPDITRVGKLMIAHCLISSEAQSVIAPGQAISDDRFAFLKRVSSLRIDGHERRLSGSDSWLSRLFWLLAEESSFEDFLRRLSNIDFVCFNYDRCIEHYLVNAAISYFRLDDQRADLTLRSIKIVHPYGSLGQLKIQGRLAVGFGLKPNLTATADRIRTFTEGSGEDGLHESVKERLHSAHFVLFLGFGFLTLNLDLIFGKNPVFEPREIAATSLGLSDTSTRLISEYVREKHNIGREIARKAGGPINVGELKVRFLEVGCSQLLDHYHHFLRKL